MTTYNEDIIVNGRIGVNSPNLLGKIDINSAWDNWIFLKQQRDIDGGGGFMIHNPWGNSDQPQGDPSRNRLEVGYHNSQGQDLWLQFVIHGPTGNIGIGTFPTEKLDIKGNIKVSGDVLLVGADCAEEFDVVCKNVVSGTVMVINEDGALEPSQAAYDKRVAGVVSGAGSHKPGIILDNQSTKDNRAPIALVGKVYCNVDAKYGSIKIGDLLTTSDTVGCAMRVSDHSKAMGSIIGKALKSLDSGIGSIPILIALQ